MKKGSWTMNRAVAWIRKHGDAIGAVAFGLAVALAVGALATCNVRRQEREFRGVRFDGIHKGRDSTLVTFERDGRMEGRSFARYEDAAAFAEAVR